MYNLINNNRYSLQIPDVAGTICETVHVALVCMGKCSRNITPMLKSLLHHRQNPLHFHVIVDNMSEQTIGTLFDMWDLPDGNLIIIYD